MQLVEKIRAGIETYADREEIARGHMRLALKIAGQYTARYQRGADEFLSSALFGVAHAIDKAKDKLRDNNITGWIIVNIHRFILTDQRSARAMRRSSGGTVSLNTAGIVYGRHYMRVRRSRILVEEIREKLDDISDTQDDISILGMREAGYTFDEIAEKMQWSKGCVVRRYKLLEARFNKLR